MANRPSRFGFGRRDKRALWRFGMKKGRRCRSWYAPLARCCGSDRGGAGGGARTICNALHDRGLGFRRAPRPGRNLARYCVWLYDQKQHRYGKDFLAEQMESLRNLQPLGAGQISSSHMRPANSWIAVYRVVRADGSWPVRQLVPVRSCLVESTPDGEKPTAIVITQFEGGQRITDKTQQKWICRQLSISAPAR